MSNNTENVHGGLTLSFGYSYADLFSPEKLKDLNTSFHSYYEAENPEEYKIFKEYSSKVGEGYDAVVSSTILINAARYLNNFTGELFGIKDSMSKLKEE